MTNQTELVEMLADLAGPLGPFRTPEEMDQIRNNWLNNLDEVAIQGLLKILTDPPPPSVYTPATRDAFELELTNALIDVGGKNPDRLLELITPLLAHKLARPIIIEVIGALGLAEGTAILKNILQEQQLTTDELVRLACALGEIGDPEARVILESMRMMPQSTNTEFRREIEIAMENM